MNSIEILGGKINDCKLKNYNVVSDIRWVEMWSERVTTLPIKMLISTTHKLNDVEIIMQ